MGCPSKKSRSGPRIALAAAVALSALISFTYAEDAAEQKAEQEIDRAAKAWNWAWGDFCRRNIFGQNAMPYELSPGPDSVNQKPWLSYCKGYFDAMFELMQMFKLICVPEGTRMYQIGGSVIVAYAKASEKQKQMPPPVFAMGVWVEKFPCKSK
jgi:hypothetical protein